MMRSLDSDIFFRQIQKIWLTNSKEFVNKILWICHTIQWPHRYVGHTAWAPEGREGRSQRGPKGLKLEVGAQRAPKLLVLIYSLPPYVWQIFALNTDFADIGLIFIAIIRFNCSLKPSNQIFSVVLRVSPFWQSICCVPLFKSFALSEKKITTVHVSLLTITTSQKGFPFINISRIKNAVPVTLYSKVTK